MGKLTNVTYMDTGGGVMCYSALYDGKYWVFGNEDIMLAYSIDPLNTVDEDGFLVDPNEYEITDAEDFPTWREVIESIPTSVCDSYYEGGREELMQLTLEWVGNLDMPVNKWEEE